MGVCVEGQLDDGVAQPILDYFGMNGGAERDRGVRMAKVVEADAGEALAHSAPHELVGDRVGISGSPITRGKDQVELCPVLISIGLMGAMAGTEASGLPAVGLGTTLMGGTRFEPLDHPGRAFWEAGLDVLNRARADVRLRPLQSIFEQYDALDRILVLSVPELHDPNVQLAENVRPMGRDQPYVAERVAAIGAGLVIPADAAPETIAQALARLLAEPSFRRIAQQIRGSIAA